MEKLIDLYTDIIADISEPSENVQVFLLFSHYISHYIWI